MSQLFLESPVTIGVVGLIFTLMALITWMKGGYKGALVVALIAVILTILLIALSINVKTDREQIQQTLTDVAAAVQQNDVAKVLTYVHPSATAGVTRVKSELPSFRFTEARITGVKSITVDKTSTPQSAIAEFNVAVSVASQGTTASGIRRFVRCYFLHRDGKWLVNDYQHYEVSAGFRADEP